MPEKGKTNNPNGRPVGSQNKKSKQWLDLGESIITIHAERFNTILSSIEDDKFIDTYTKILEYFKPKLARTETKNEHTINEPIIVEWSDKISTDSETTGSAPTTTNE